MPSSSASTVISSGSSTKRCKSCQEDLPETKFKTNGNKSDGTRSRMATCRDCSSSTTSSSKASISTRESASQDDMVRMKKLQTIETLVKIGVKTASRV
jgi:hypothetical protein